MCGFTGFVGETENAKMVLENMMNKIIHRGPDSSGMFVENEAALGFRRLSIIDLEHGSQPLYNEDHSLVLIFNGEIYNFQELKEQLISKGHQFVTHTDSEVLLHGYEEYGEKLVEKLRGMFAFVIWDKINKKLFAARDMFGIKPFYYAHTEGTLLFGSEIKSFLPHPRFNKVLNEKALKPYLTFQYSVLNETFFKGVFKLPASHYMTYENGQVSIQRYWSPKFNPTEQPLEEIVNEIDDVVRDSVHAHQISDVKVGSFLSSGVDSSYVASVLRPNKTFTVGFSDQNFSEIDNAKALSDELNIENVNKVLDSDLCFEKLNEMQYIMDEPHSNPSIVPLYFLSELASRDVTVVLSGEGADELFAGYAEYDGTLPLKKYRKLPLWIRKPLGVVANNLPDFKGKNILVKGGLPAEDWFIGQARIFQEKEANSLLKDEYKNGKTVKEIVNPYYEQVNKEDDVTKMQFLDLHLWLVDDILLKADKMSMAHSLELRVPFLDRKVMETAEKVLTKYRINEKGTKYAFRLAAARSIPKEFANRKKIGFPVPIRNWIRTEKYYAKIKSYFMSANAAEFFNQAEIMDLLNEHYEGKKNNARKVWTIFTFLIWYKEYFNEEE
ncbi:asparagine synthase (glutamine-hydrolyzing) [Oceanobacillus piezotolerans]|uniref:asparagine synthase (glutamine-hydrolyzing) n=1 Tax=Oceanobacillus piezotolerans TaxID=2448030 RepID=A0A498D9P7_9BACI|nr:asparagine synthase (glutamine-hydrolyzing) [Oceanobacillus piezotolerans]RLL47834.1 asparagine synthase (glutamine-hydrolyzing) [Oceanobacillus piezotolerans]